MKVLVVKSAFGGRERGMEITDQQEVETILAGEQAHYVTVTERDEPAPEPSAIDTAKKKKQATTEE